MNFLLYNYEVFVAVSFSTFHVNFSINFFNLIFQSFFCIASVAKLRLACVFLGFLLLFTLARHLLLERILFPVNTFSYKSVRD